jgi:4-hydroxybenzoate polyprenyltransferase
VRGLVRACHLQPTLAVTGLTTILAVSVGRGIGSLAAAAAVLAGQLSVGWSNDYLDRDRDVAAGRRDKPIVAGEVSATLVGRAALVAAIVCIPLSFLSGWRAAVVHLVAVAAAWAYNAGLKRTVISVVPYAVAFGLLPAFVTLGLPTHPWPPAWATAAASLMGAGGHFVNTLADRDDDALTGVRGLPQRVSRTASLLIGTLLLGLALAVLAIGPAGTPSPTTIVLLALGVTAVVGVVATSVTGHDRAAWSLTLVTAGSAVLALVVNGNALTTGT